ncbi:MAG: hypothetical protein ACREL3_08430 [Gemmatimonadales bacterium]
MRVGFEAGAAAVAIALTIVAAATGAPDIPQMFRGDAAHRIDAATGRLAWRTDKERWRFSTEGLVWSSPPVAADSVLFRRYLGAGGKVVWLGTPPLIWPRDVKTGDLSYDQVDGGAAKQLLGVDFRRSNFDTWGNTATAEGRRWGLSGWWEASWLVDPAGVTDVLSLDDNGLAGSWAKHYGGPVGTGFVRISGESWSGGPAPHYAQIPTVAEYRPMPAR